MTFLQVLVQGNNIFYKSHISSSHLINITENGKADEIYNGVTDWLYEGKCSSYTDPVVKKIVFVGICAKFVSFS